MTLSAAEGTLELLTSPVHIVSGLSYTFAYPTTFSDFYTMLNRKPTIYCWSIDCCGIRNISVTSTKSVRSITATGLERPPKIIMAHKNEQV